MIAGTASEQEKRSRTTGPKASSATWLVSLDIPALVGLKGNKKPQRVQFKNKPEV